ncbi:MAG: hypothetical protein OCC45_01555 [Desulfotalea sp.]
METLPNFSKNNIDPKIAIATLLFILAVTIWLIFWLFPSAISGFSIHNFNGNWKCDAFTVAGQDGLSIKKDNRYIEINTNAQKISMVADLTYFLTKQPESASSVTVATDVDATFGELSIDLVKQRVTSITKKNDSLNIINEDFVSTLTGSFATTKDLGKLKLVDEKTLNIDTGPQYTITQCIKIE